MRKSKQILLLVFCFCSLWLHNLASAAQLAYIDNGQEQQCIGSFCWKSFLENVFQDKIKKEDSSKAYLAVGQVVELVVNNSPALRAAFLGQRENAFYFYDLSRHQLLKTLSLEPVNQGSTPIMAQSMIKISAQGNSKTCTIWSLIHALRILNLNSMVSENSSQWKDIIDGDLATVDKMNHFFGSEIGITDYLPGFWEILFHLRQPFGDRQVVARSEFLNKLGIKNKVTHSIKEVVAHLGHAPVILDVDVDTQWGQIYDEKGHIAETIIETSPAYDRYRHAVVAYGYFVDERSNGFTIIYDSGEKGYFYVWPISNIETLLEFKERNDAVLIYSPQPAHP